MTKKVKNQRLLASLCAVLKLLLPLTLLSLMSGCSLPGSNINSNNLFQSADLKVNVVPITPDLLIDMVDKGHADQSSSVNLTNFGDDHVYRVGAGDVLNVTVWDHPELTIPAGQFRSAGESGNVVHQDGSIFYPYVGKLKVAGLDVTQIRELISKSLSKFIEDPQVDVSVAAFNSQKVFVSGSVVNPSTLPVTNVPLSLLDAISACGGLASDADWRKVTLTRTGNEGSRAEVLDLYALLQLGDMSQNRILMPGDVIHIPRNDALKVFVMGDVLKAATQRIDRSGLTLAEAINNVGGINESTADASGIFVIRSAKDDGVNVYQLDASVGSMLIMSTKFELEPMDIVYVTSVPVARWNRLIAQLLPTVTAIYQLDRLDR
jgi:polysaccharide export outer membrane protein